MENENPWFHGFFRLNFIPVDVYGWPVVDLRVFKQR
jgi:hypothetical protein